MTPEPKYRAPLPSGTMHLDGVRKRALEMGRNRLVITAGVFALAFFAIGLRMIDVTVVQGSAQTAVAGSRAAETRLFDRADVTDRNGVLLATSLPASALYAHPREIADPVRTARRVTEILPDLNAAEIQARLQSERAFVYIHRSLTPLQTYQINALGVPGLYFETTERRVYPQGQLTAHITGLTDIDNKGIAGIEKTFDQELTDRRQPLRLSIDLRVQSVLHAELTRAKAEFNAIGAAGLIMDTKTGEILAMVSLPDFDPNTPSSATPDALFNRVTLGVYEMGSTFKLFNTAAALDSGTSKMNSVYDVSSPIKIARFSITDYHRENHPLTVADILKVSSNIGSAQMAMAMGTENQKNFMQRMGMLRPASIELPETGAPLFPQNWREINTMTISYGHGMAVTPLHVVSGVSALINGGYLHPATLLAREGSDPLPGSRVLKPKTSEDMRTLMRLVVAEGTGGKANVPGYEVGGKTGTAEKTGVGGYRHKALLSSFVAAFPMSDPRYTVLAIVDEPQGTRQTYGFATGGWTAAPIVGRVIAQIAPLLGIEPVGTRDVAAKKGQDARYVTAKHNVGVPLDDAE